MTAPPRFPAGQRILERVQGFLDRLREERVRIWLAAEIGRAHDRTPVTGMYLV